MSSVILGAVALRSRRASVPARARVPWSRLEIVGFAGILLLAVAARVLWIDTLPRAYFGDEPRIGMFLRNAYKEAIPNFFTMGWNDWAVIGLSLQGLLAPVLGLRISTLRLASALFGSLAVGATYLLTRELFTRRTAVFAALLLAVCRTAIEFSRLGVCHAQVMLFETLAFFCWWRGVNTGKATSYWWAGVGLGLCLLTYNAGDLAPLLWLGWLGLSVVLVPRSLRVYWRGAVITAAGFLVVAYPWLHYLTDHLTFGPTWEHWTFIAHSRQAMGEVLAAWHTSGADAAAAILWRQVWRTWLGFGVLPGGAYPELGYRGGGMLDHVSAPLLRSGSGAGSLSTAPPPRRLRRLLVAVDHHCRRRPHHQSTGLRPAGGHLAGRRDPRGAAPGRAGSLGRGASSTGANTRRERASARRGAPSGSWMGELADLLRPIPAGSHR